MKAKLYNGCHFHAIDVATEHFCSNSMNLYYGGAWFESRTRCRLSWVIFFVVLPRVQ